MQVFKYIQNDCVQWQLYVQRMFDKSQLAAAAKKKQPKQKSNTKNKNLVIILNEIMRQNILFSNERPNQTI